MRKLLPLALAALAGCGTVADTVGRPFARFDTPAPHVFGGVRSDWQMADGGLCCVVSAFAPCFLFDLPLSLAGDLVLLPVTVPISIFRPRPLTAEEATKP